MRTLLNHYINNFRGLSKEIWLLSLVTFVNRAGAMVIPFLSLYLENDKCLTLPQIGWIMSSFGLGSFFGTLVGGKLTDKIGFYKVIILSLFLGGFGFIGLQYMDTLAELCVGVFVLIFVADAYRPAVFVACDAYSKPENITRSIALIRLAINLGFSIGPMFGGFIIARISYSSLFWIDGVSCIIAAAMLFMLLKPKTAKEKLQEEAVKEGVSPYKNGIYMLLVTIMILCGIMFVQYFSVVPLYYKNVHFLSEEVIGLILFLNGAMIVFLEMPLVGWLEKIKISKTMAIFWSMIFLALSFIVMNMSSWVGVLIIGMILMTISEMVGSPFANSLALEMSPKGRKGTYMALFSMSFSLSHIFGHNGGMNLAHEYGYDWAWNIMFVALIFVALLSLWLHKLVRKKYI